MRRKLLTILTLAVCSLAPSRLPAQAPASAPASEIAPPANPATAEQIREYLGLTNYVANAHKMMGQMLNTSRATAAPYFPASFWDDMDKSILEIDLVDPTIPAYQKYFSQQDMAATIAFYKSPAGQKLLAAQPFIAYAAGDVLRLAGQKVGQQVFARHKDEIEALKKQSEGAPATATPAPAPVSPQPK